MTREEMDLIVGISEKLVDEIPIRRFVLVGAVPNAWLVPVSVNELVVVRLDRSKSQSVAIEKDRTGHSSDSTANIPL